ncbi:beta strand repeat-containing protein [Roseateles albus]|uniref:PEP-CTERM sorting domain-containing protein n=1 Tax=Roseateles albus TaxID=2987525 RepID=A0ABT5KMF5_9BURK|nr:PEP-CTERM sorting domain-containing protein [Roseateles albus]MDC8774105.1 PEP-CTERM sorting domain-containing protein [Roseateles albus]
MHALKTPAVRQDLNPKRLCLALTHAAVLLLSGPAAQAAVTVTGPYWLVPWDPIVLGPGDIDLTNSWLVIGSGAAGSFSATAGSQVKLGGLALASAGGSASGLIDGIGTRVELHFGANQGRLDVGHFGSAELTVSGGAVVAGRVNSAACALGGCYNQVGSTAGSTGILNITGAGSQVSLLGSFSVGNIYADKGFGVPGADVHGHVSILNGGVLTTDEASLGNSYLGPASLGTERSFAAVKIQGSDSRWHVTGGTADGREAWFNMANGSRSNADVSMSDGGRLDIESVAGRNYGMRVGNGGTATLTVTGKDSQLTLSGDADRGFLHIAEGGGAGVLSIENGGTLSSTARWVQVGLNGGDGKFIVTGPKSTASFASSSGITIGNAATGDVQVLDGATLAAGQLNIASRQGNGKLLLTGAGSQIKLDAVGMHRLMVGDWGQGIMEVSGGALLEASGNAVACKGQWCGSIIGQTAGSDAKFTVTGAGSRASFINDLQIGNIYVWAQASDGWTNGTPGGVTHASVRVLDGAQLESDTVHVGGWIGQPAATGGERSVSSLLVSGAGSLWRVNGSEQDGRDAWVGTGSHARASADWQILQGGQLLLDAPAGRNASLNLSDGGGQTDLLISDTGSALNLKGERANISIASSAGGKATLTVQNGATASLLGLADSHMQIGGNSGQGVLKVLSGGQVSGARSLNVGGPAGAGGEQGRGDVFVDGVGSRLTLMDGQSTLRVGERGLGQLSVSGCGLVSTGNIELGMAPGSQGTLNISGAGSKLELAAVNTHRLYLGTGSVTVAAGGELDGKLNASACNGGVWCATLVGANAGANASLTVTGAGSKASFLGHFQVGRAELALPPFDGWTEGTPGGATVATVRVLDGGLLQTDHVSAGLGTFSLGATGSESALVNLSIKGKGSTWAITGGDTDAYFNTQVWNAKNSSVNLNISDGGKMKLLAPMGMGAYMNLSAMNGDTQVNISGKGSSLDFVSDSFSFLGLGSYQGRATMTLSDGARMTGLNDLTLGWNQGQGSLTLDGAGTALELGADAYISIGQGGQGQINVNHGAKIFDSSGHGGFLDVGFGRSNGLAPGSGSVNISGAGSEIHLHSLSSISADGTEEGYNPYARFGYRGDGRLSITAGGSMVLQGDAVSTVADPRLTTLLVGAGRAVGLGVSTGMAQVNGVNSRLQVIGSDALIALGQGEGGFGQMQVLDQAQVETTVLKVGAGGGTGSLLVDKAQVNLSGQWTSSDSHAALVVGAGAGSSGQVQLANGALVLISNPGAQGASMTLGGSKHQDQGAGSLSMVSGSQIKLEAAPGLATVNVGRSGVGIASLDGGSSLDVGDGVLYIGRLTGSVGVMTLAGGSSVKAGYVGVGSMPGVDGGVGTLIVNDSTLSTSTLEIGAKGFVGGNGFLNAGSIVNRGVFSPGNSPGTLTLGGSFTNQAGGRLVLEVQAKGTGGFDIDQLIFGDAAAIDLSGLQISFKFLGNTDPNAFQSSGGFQIDNFLHRSSGAGLDDALFQKVSFSASSDVYHFQSFSFTAAGGAVFVAQAVPEPGTWLMLLGGLVWIGSLARRRRGGPTSRRPRSAWFRE